MKCYTCEHYHEYIFWLDVVVNANVTFYYVTRLVLATSCLSMDILMVDFYSDNMLLLHEYMR